MEKVSFMLCFIGTSGHSLIDFNGDVQEHSKLLVGESGGKLKIQSYLLKNKQNHTLDCPIFEKSKTIEALASIAILTLELI